MAAKAAVGAENDLHPRPGPAQALDQQGQYGPGVFGVVDFAGAQIADQKLLAAENIERQKAVVVVIAVEKAAFLAAVDDIVGGVEIEHPLLGRLFVGGDKGVDHGFVHPPDITTSGAVFQAAEGRGAGQLFAPVQGGLQGGVEPQILVVLRSA